MGLFRQAEPAPVETAKKPPVSQAKTAAALIGLLLIILFPGYSIAVVTGVLIAEKRRVRISWYLLWALVSLVLGMLLSGSAATWLGWNLAGVGHLTPRLLPHDVNDVASPLTVAATFANRTLASALIAQLISGLPAALLTCAVIVRYRAFARSELGRIEGQRFSNIRPVGILDRARIRRERARIAAGHYLPDPPALDSLEDLRAKFTPRTDLPAKPHPSTSAPAPSSQPDIPSPTESSDTPTEPEAAGNRIEPAPRPAVDPVGEHPTEPQNSPVDPDDPFALAPHQAGLATQHTIRKPRP